jgi:hypothetical protein
MTTVERPASPGTATERPVIPSLASKRPIFRGQALERSIFRGLYSERPDSALGVTRAEDIAEFSPSTPVRHEITSRGSFAGITPFAAAIDGTHRERALSYGTTNDRISPDDYGKALDALEHDSTVHKVVLVP